MFTFNNFILCSAFLFTCTYSLCQWESDDSNVWYQEDNKRWSEHKNHDIKKFSFIQTVYPGDFAVVIQQRGLPPVLLDADYAYSNGQITAEGGWEESYEAYWQVWNGNERGDGRRPVRFERAGIKWVQTWKGVPSLVPKEYYHIQMVETYSTAVVLQHSNDWASVLTDSHAYYNGFQMQSGRWARICSWNGTRSYNTEIIFRRISPTSWKEYDNGAYKSPYNQLHETRRGDKAVVMQDWWSEVVILDKNYAYRENKIFARGYWNSSSRDKWEGVSLNGDATRFSKDATVWYEYRNEKKGKKYTHVQNISPYKTAVVLFKTNYLLIPYWVYILDDTKVASYGDESIATGYWNTAENSFDCESEVTSYFEEEGRISKRRTPVDQQICIFRNDTGNRLAVLLTERDSRNRIVPPNSRSLERDADYIISLFQIERHLQSRSGTVLSWNGFRIDIQGSNTGQSNYRNIQVQTGHMSVAQINCPIDELFLTNRDVRRGLLHSLWNSTLTTLTYERYTRK